MKRPQHLVIALLAGALLLAGFASNALALTDACTVISNQASLTYSVGGVPQVTPVLSDGDAVAAGTQATTFTVGTRVDLTVATVNSPVTAPGANNVQTFSITNTGNDTQRYSLRLWAGANAVTSGIYTDNFDMTDTNIRVYTDNDSNFGNGTLAQISATAADDGTHIGYTANVLGNVPTTPVGGNVIYVHVLADTPAGRANGDAALYALQAVTHQPVGLNGDDGAGGQTDGGETTENGAVTENGCGNVIVLGDDDGDGGGDFDESGGGTLSDSARNGDDYAVGVFVVDTASITVTKSYTVIWDPINQGVGTQRAIPGARVEYTMDIENTSATVDATGLSLTDQIPVNTDFYGGSIVLPVGANANYSTTLPPGPPVFGAAAPGAGVTDPTITYINVDNFDLAAGATETVTFVVVIE